MSKQIWSPSIDKLPNTQFTNPVRFNLPVNTFSSALSLSDDIVAVRHWKQKAIYVYSLSTQQLIAELKHEHTVVDFIHLNGDYILSFDSCNGMHLWDVLTGRCIGHATASDVENIITPSLFTPYGSYSNTILFCQRDELKVIDIGLPSRNSTEPTLTQVIARSCNFKSDRQWSRAQRSGDRIYVWSRYVVFVLEAATLRTLHTFHSENNFVGHFVTPVHVGAKYVAYASHDRITVRSVTPPHPVARTFDDIGRTLKLDEFPKDQYNIDVMNVAVYDDFVFFHISPSDKKTFARRTHFRYVVSVPTGQVLFKHKSTSANGSRDQLTNFTQRGIFISDGHHISLFAPVRTPSPVTDTITPSAKPNAAECGTSKLDAVTESVRVLGLMQNFIAVNTSVDPVAPSINNGPLNSNSNTLTDTARMHGETARSPEKNSQCAPLKRPTGMPKQTDLSGWKLEMLPNFELTKDNVVRLSEKNCSILVAAYVVRYDTAKMDKFVSLQKALLEVFGKIGADGLVICSRDKVSSSKLARKIVKKMKMADNSLNERFLKMKIESFLDKF